MDSKQFEPIVVIAYIHEPQILLLRAILPAYLVVLSQVEHLILNQRFRALLPNLSPLA
jgi:hypothetical protein